MLSSLKDRASNRWQCLPQSLTSSMKCTRTTATENAFSVASPIFQVNNMLSTVTAPVDTEESKNPAWSVPVKYKPSEFGMFHSKYIPFLKYLHCKFVKLTTILMHGVLILLALIEQRY